MIARRLAVFLLVPSLACASFEAEIIEPVDPSLAAGTVRHTSFELQPSSPPPSSQPSTSPTTSTTTTTTQPTAGTTQPTTTPGTTTATTTPTTTTTTTTTPGGATPVAGTGGAGPAPAGAATAPKVGDEATVDKVEPESSKAQRTRNALFWTGVTLAAVGGAGVLGFGIAGRVTQGQIAKGYDDDSLSHARERELRDRGDAMNIGAATTGAIGILGIAVFSIVLGVDYVRCGTLTTKRRKDCVPRRRR